MCKGKNCLKFAFIIYFKDIKFDKKTINQQLNLPHNYN